MTDVSPYLTRKRRTEFEARYGAPPAELPRISQVYKRFPKRRISTFEIVFAALCLAFLAAGTLTAIFT